MNLLKLSFCFLILSCANYDGSFNYYGAKPTTLSHIYNFSNFISETLLRAKFNNTWQFDKLTCKNNTGFIKKNHLGETSLDNKTYEKIKLSFDNCSLDSFHNNNSSIKLNGYLIYDVIKNLDLQQSSISITFHIKDADISFVLSNNEAQSEVFNCNIKNLNTTADFSFSDQNYIFTNIDNLNLTYSTQYISTICYQEYNNNDLSSF